MDFLKLQIGETHILHILVLPDSSYRRVLIIKKFLMNDFSIVMVWTPHHSEVSGSISCHHRWKVWAPHTYNTYTATKAPLPPSPPWLHGPWIPVSPQSTASAASPVSLCHCLMRTWPSFTCPVQASHITAGASSSWLREGPSFPPPLPCGSCPAAVGLQDVRCTTLPLPGEGPSWSPAAGLVWRRPWAPGCPHSLPATKSSSSSCWWPWPGSVRAAASQGPLHQDDGHWGVSSHLWLSWVTLLWARTYENLWGLCTMIYESVPISQVLLP